VQGSDSASQDSLECRLYHAIASLSTGQAVHCTHYNATSPYCNGKVTTDRAHYCEVLEYNCGNGTSANAQFANKQQCNSTAAGYPNTNTVADDARDNGANNLGCREYHAQASRGAGASVHCEHAGPSGAGVCGKRYQAWGSILAAAPCNDPSVNMFITAVGNVTVNNAVPTGVSTANPYVPYSTTFDVDKNTQICRIYHLGVASTDTSHCSHGSIGGANLCGMLVPNLCDFIQGTCGFGATAYQFTDRATCISGLTNSATNNITVGLPNDATGNTLACRFYHAGVAASFLPTGSQGATTGASDNVKTHCGHVLKVASAGGCGYVATGAPTTAPGKNAAASISLVASFIAMAASVFAL